MSLIGDITKLLRGSTVVRLEFKPRKISHPSSIGDTGLMSEVECQINVVDVDENLSLFTGNSIREVHGWLEIMGYKPTLGGNGLWSVSNRERTERWANLNEKEQKAQSIQTLASNSSDNPGTLSLFWRSVKRRCGALVSPMKPFRSL
jgi:hypothetical protein